MIEALLSALQTVLTGVHLLYLVTGVFLGLLFGIPGSGSMAVFLGGMVLIGLEPGPAMVGSKLETTYTIVWSLALANVVGAGTCLLISKHVAYLTTIRYALMAPFMIMVICFAAFQATRDLGDLAALFAIGMLGVLMKRFDWPRPAFLIGFVLAAGMETCLYQAVQFDGWGFLTKPGVLIIGALTVISLVCGVKFGHAPEADSGADSGADEREPTGRAINLTSQTAFAAVVVAAFAYGLYDAFRQSFLGGVFSGGVAAVMLVFSGIVLFKLATRRVDDPVNFDNEIAAGYVDNAEVASLREFIFWLAGFLVAAWLVGYLIRTPRSRSSCRLGDEEVDSGLGQNFRLLAQVGAGLILACLHPVAEVLVVLPARLRPGHEPVVRDRAADPYAARLRRSVARVDPRSQIRAFAHRSTSPASCGSASVPDPCVRSRLGAPARRAGAGGGRFFHVVERE